MGMSVRLQQRWADIYFLKVIAGPCGWRFASPHKDGCLNDAHPNDVSSHFWSYTYEHRKSEYRLGKARKSGGKQAGPAHGHRHQVEQVFRAGAWRAQESGRTYRPGGGQYSLDKAQAQREVD